MASPLTIDELAGTDTDRDTFYARVLPIQGYADTTQLMTINIGTFIAWTMYNVATFGSGAPVSPPVILGGNSVAFYFDIDAAYKMYVYNPGGAGSWNAVSV